MKIRRFSRRISPWLLGFAVIGSLSLAAVAQQIPAELAAGFKAGFTCSAVFHAGRTLEQVLEEELGGLDQIKGVPDPTVDYETKSVTCAYSEEKPARLAVFIDNLGTVLLAPGATPADADALRKVAIPMPEGDPATIPWPDGDLLPETSWPPEVDKATLDQAIEDAFTGEKYKPHKTLGVAIVYKDQLIAERYAEGWTMHTQYRTWSAAKSITNALVGIVVGQGRLRVDQPAPISEWQGEDDPRREITIEELFHMSSGLKGEGAMTLRAYWGGIDTAAAAASQPLEVTPGTRFDYSNYDTLLLVKAMREVLPDFETYLTFPRRELLNKIGMRHTFPETDPHGNFILSSQVYSTPRDLARFGLLFLHDGVWNGERILPEGWVDYSMTPAPAHPRGEDGNGYGKQWWLIGFNPRVPEGAYQSAGHRGQHTTVVPSHNLVIARMGLDPMEGEGWSQARFVADVVAAIKK
jgi:CubicO group peptidase (beta-lactamase class C family)